MISPFGVDHGEVSKAFGGSVLGQAMKGQHGVGAGGMLARDLAGGQGPKHGRISAVAYKGHRKNAKMQGKRAARQFQQLGTPKTYGGYESAHPGVGSANTGWSQRAESVKAITKPAAAAPAGMRGPIKSRVKTTKMRENEKGFI